MPKQLTLEILQQIHEEKLKELVPNDDAVIHRYMNFPKFMSLLVSRNLFFTRADKFEDPLEGEIPELYLDRLFWSFDRAPLTDALFSIFNCAKEEVKKNVIDSYYQKRATTFISCWNESTSESYALWKIYAQDYGVAIQTSVRKLQEVTQLSGSEIFKVKYLGKSVKDFIAPRFSKEGIENYNFFVFKKEQYNYENEIRLIISGTSGDFQIVEIDDLSYFIDKIIVSPFAEKWFLEMVRKVTEKYGLAGIEVSASTITI